MLNDIKIGVYSLVVDTDEESVCILDAENDGAGTELSIRAFEEIMYNLLLELME